MIKAIQQLKQDNPSALSFALAGMISLVIAMILLFFLWQSITTEKQITELQTTGQRLAKIVDSQAFAEGDAKSFAEFAQLVKSFNQQWDGFKQLQNNYPIEKIKEIDGMKNTLNTRAPKWLALQKEIVAQTLAKKELYNNTQKMRQMNDEVLNMLLRANADKQQILATQRISLNLPPIEFKNGKDDEWSYFTFMEVWGGFFENEYLLANLLKIDNNQNIIIISDLEAKNILTNELLLYKKTEELYVNIGKNFSDINLEKDHLSILVNEISERLFLLNKNSINNFVMYFCYAVLFASVSLLLFLNIRKYDIIFVVYFLLTFILMIVIVCEISKKQELFNKTNNIKISNDYINGVLLKIDIKKFNNVDLFKLTNIINEKNKKFDKLKNIKFDGSNKFFRINSIFLDFNKNIEKMSRDKNVFIELETKRHKTINYISLALAYSDFLSDQDSIIQSYPAQKLLMMKELDKRFRIIAKYILYSYTNSSKIILNSPIDLTLSDYIATLRKNPNIANTDYTIDPEIQNKIKTLNTEIESFKQSFRAALAVKEAALAIRDKNLELNAELTRLYNQQINKELMIMTLYSWLCVLFCVHGYVRAINKNKKDDTLESEL